jgi:hypothetical protein
MQLRFMTKIGRKRITSIAKFLDTVMQNDMQRFHKILPVPKGSLNNFFYMKKEKEKMGGCAVKCPKTFCQG